MSYRTLKRLLGETSLERKCRFLFGGGLLLLIAAAFYFASWKNEQLVYEQARNTGRMLVNPLLLSKHWATLDEDPDFQPVVENLSEQLLREYLPPEGWAVFRPQGAEGGIQPADEFEWDVLGRMESGNIEEAERLVPERDHYQYYGAVRFRQQGCGHCHPRGSDGPRTFVEGDLMAVYRITLRWGPTREALAENRAIALAAAILVAFLAMVAAYAIVRYVIVKPVKHLKDVSNAISRGNLQLRSSIQTGDEFEELSHAFNRMIRRLIAVQDELRRVNADLDAKVDELAQANMALYELNRLKSDFLATMSHELRTPLNSILGFSDVLLAADRLDDRQRRYVSNIQNSGRMLLTLISDILDLAKIESGKMEVRPEDFSIYDLLEALVGMARPMAERKNLQLTFEVADGVPLLRQDPLKVRQIVSNLLSNALKFTPEGGRVHVAAEVQGDQLVLSVADTGVGISEEDQARIFEKFRQGKAALPGDDALTREHPGTGLGLSIVKELTILLGGDVTLESEVGKGSTFTVRIPLVLPERRSRELLPTGATLDLGRLRQLAAETPVAAAVDE